MASGALDKLGNAYINWLRSLVTIFITLTFAGSIYLGGDILIKIYGSTKTSTETPLPGVSWNSIRDDVFPAEVESTDATTSTSGDGSPENNAQSQPAVALNPLIRDTIKNFDKTFISQGKKFEDFGYTASDFQNLVFAAAGNQGIDLQQNDHFLQGLKTLSGALARDPDITDLRNNPNMIFDKIIRAVIVYINVYAKQASEAKAEQLIAEQAALQKKLAGMSKIPLLLYSIAGFIFAVLLLIIFKVELSLRKMVSQVNHQKK